MVLNAQMSIFLDMEKQLWYNYCVEKKTIAIRCWHKHLRRSVLLNMLPKWVTGFTTKRQIKALK